MTKRTRIPHDDKGQPEETIGKLVTVWFEEEVDWMNKRIPIPASDVDWCFPGDPVIYYRVEN